MLTQHLTAVTGHFFHFGVHENAASDMRGDVGFPDSGTSGLVSGKKTAWPIEHYRPGARLGNLQEDT